MKLEVEGDKRTKIDNPFSLKIRKTFLNASWEEPLSLYVNSGANPLGELLKECEN